MNKLENELQLTMEEIFKLYWDGVPLFARTENSPALLNAIRWEWWEDILYETIMSSKKSKGTYLWRAYEWTKRKMWGRRSKMLQDDISDISSYLFDNDEVKKKLLEMDRKSLNPIADKLWLKEYRPIYIIDNNFLQVKNYPYRRIRNWNKKTWEFFVTDKWKELTRDELWPVDLKIIHPILIQSILENKEI